jgi:hypothetical protein
LLPAMISPLKTSSALSISLPLSFGLIEDTP